MVVSVSESQVLGKYIEAIVQCASQYKETNPLLDKMGMQDLEERQWYPMTVFLRFLLYMMKAHGEEALFEMGKCLVSNTVFPSRVTTLQDAFRSLDLAYTVVHRNQHGSMYSIKTKSDFQIEIVAANPYPCPFDWGIIQGLVNRFAESATVAHNFAHGCRLDGDPACHYMITF